MTIYEKLQAELNKARLAQDTLYLELLQYLIGEIGRQRVVDTTDPAVTRIVKQVNKRINEAHDLYATEKTQYEKTIMISLVHRMLPKLMTQKELNVAIDKAIADGAVGIGQVMGKLKSLRVDFDGGLAASLIKQKLVK